MNHRHPYTAFCTAHALCIVSRSKGVALNHVGIQLPDGRVAHCAPGRGEHVSSAEDFAKGQDVATIEVISQHLRAATLKRIAESMKAPQAYHPTTNNCEIFVNRMLGRNAVSPQLSAAVLIAAFAALIGLAAAA